MSNFFSLLQTFHTLLMTHLAEQSGTYMLMCLSAVVEVCDSGPTLCRFKLNEWSIKTKHMIEEC